VVTSAPQPPIAGYQQAPVRMMPPQPYVAQPMYNAGVYYDPYWSSSYCGTSYYGGGYWSNGCWYDPCIGVGAGLAVGAMAGMAERAGGRKGTFWNWRDSNG